jgi:hypothetical protein
MNAYVLPWWVQWAQAIALLVISVVGVWIASKQWRIAAAKLNLDLYDRRFAVFDAARNLILGVLQHGAALPKDLNAFRLGTADAGFLLNDDIEKYLDQLDKKVWHLVMLLERKTQVERTSADDDDGRVKVADQVATAFTAIQNELPTLVAKFKPFLKLGNI